MSERRYIRIQPGKEEDCSTGEAAAEIRKLLTKGNNISHDAALTLERSAEALEELHAGEQAAVPAELPKEKEKKSKK